MRPIELTYLLILLTACSAETLNVGSDTDSGVPLTGSTGGSSAKGAQCADPATAQEHLSSWPSNDDCVIGRGSTVFAGTWVGQVVGAPVGDETQTFRLALGTRTAGDLCGTLTVGAEHVTVALPAAQSATELYPPTSILPLQMGTVPNISPVLGLAYTLFDVVSDAHRLTASYSTAEVLKSWCQLQTAYAVPKFEGSYKCVEGFYGFELGSSAGPCYIYTGSAADQKRQTACNVVQYCGVGGCVCNACGCTADMSLLVALNLSFDADRATGTYANATVELLRVAQVDAGS